MQQNGRRSPETGQQLCEGIWKLAIEAGDIINKLLEEKLLAASYAVAHYDQEHSNELLADIAEAMEVDEIYSYDSRGRLSIPVTVTSSVGPLTRDIRFMSLCTVAAIIW
ncbi:MAG: hypothetical protein U5N58_02425 [Actinomycetota bacterium]|nr:hypothetical protein [Actinomycetota bacterium]